MKLAVFFGVISYAYSQTCPGGFELIEKKDGFVCEKKITKRAKLSCPSGFRKVYRAGSAFCRRRDVREPLESCPEGFVQDGGRCKRIIEEEVDFKCSEGFELTEDGSSCVKTRIVGSKQRCNDDESLTSDGQCLLLKKDDAKFRCKDGILEGRRCRIEQEKDAQVKCAAGYILKRGVCERRIRRDVLFKCPRGLELDETKSNICRGVRFSKPERVCRAELDNGQCFKSVVEDKEQICADGFELVKEQGHAICRKCHSPSQKKCVYKAVLLQCPEGFKPISDAKESKCVKRVPVQFEFECEEGRLTDDNRCARRFREPSIPFCLEGFELSGEGQTQGCFKVLQQDPIFFCSGGFELDGQICRRTIFRRAIAYCQGEARLVDGDMCLLKVFRPADLFCQNSEAELLPNGKCRLFVFRDRIPFCSTDGFRLRDDACVKIVYRPLNFSCDDGFNLEKNNCIRVRTRDIIADCEDEDFELDEEELTCSTVLYQKPSFEKDH